MQVFEFFASFIIVSLPSIRQHLSCGDVWRITGKIIRTVLCFIVFIHFMSAVVDVDSSHITASSSTSWSSFSPPSDFVSGHMSTILYGLSSVTGHNHILFGNG